jgi:hypothetical protein
MWFNVAQWGDPAYFTAFVVAWYGLDVLNSVVALPTMFAVVFALHVVGLLLVVLVKFPRETRRENADAALIEPIRYAYFVAVIARFAKSPPLSFPTHSPTCPLYSWPNFRTSSEASLVAPTWI